VALLLLAALLALSTAAYGLGRRRALRQRAGGRKLHSLPGYYGVYVALWCAIPALLVLAFGLGSRLLTFAAVAVLALSAAVAGGAWALSRVHPELKAIYRVEGVVRRLLLAASLVAILTTLGIVLSLVFEAMRFFARVPVTELLFGLHWSPQTAMRAEQVGASGSFGAVPLFVGTALVSLIAMAVAVPVGLLSAIYMAEYAGRRARNVLKPLLEILAGIPTVVYGFFALTFVTPILQRIWPETQVFNALSASIVVGLMIIPVVASLTEDALSAVPLALREGAFALGATRFEVSLRTVLPAALSGVIASFILAMSRAIGETMIVAIAAGATPNLTLNPLVSVQTMTAYIVQVSMGEVSFGTVEYQTIFAVGLTLFLLTLLMNIASIFILRRFREVYE
jgi:phosphate transport system permease protein